MKSLMGILPLVVLSLFMKKCGSDDLTTGGTFQGLEGTRVGQVAQSFTLKDRFGNEVSLSDYRGNVILIDFSTMWCAPCREEAAAAEAFFQTYGKFGFVSITVLFENNEGRPPSPADLKSWIDSFGLTFPVLEDGDKRAWNAYNETSGLPLNVIIDKDFVIRYKEEGYAENTIRGIVEQYLR